MDGDTIHVEIDGADYPVRYIGIDCPETVHPGEMVEWMGPEATAANRRLVQGQTVYLEKDVVDRDQYGRLLRYVFLADGTFVNAELVRLGYAQVSTIPPDVRYQEQLVAMQEEAIQAGRGLWGATPAAAAPTGPVGTPVAGATPLTPSPAGRVQIVYVFYDGVLYEVEGDEYVTIKNLGDTPVNLAGWGINAGDPGQDFLFPSFVLNPGQECRVYTNEIHVEWCGFSFGSGRALWSNQGDCGYLYDHNGILVSTFCY